MEVDAKMQDYLSNHNIGIMPINLKIKHPGHRSSLPKSLINNRKTFDQNGDPFVSGIQSPNEIKSL